MSKVITRIIMVALCLLLTGCLGGHISKLCKELQNNARIADKAIVKSLTIQAKDPNAVSDADIAALIQLRDSITKDAGAACTLNELIPEK